MQPEKYLTIDLRGLVSGDLLALAKARRQLANEFGGSLEDMRVYYGWRIDAPVLKLVVSGRECFPDSWYGHNLVDLDHSRFIPAWTWFREGWPDKVVKSDYCA